MDFIEKEATDIFRYHRRNFKSLSNLSKAKEHITQEINGTFKNATDALQFLSIIKSNVELDYNEHKKVCKHENGECYNEQAYIASLYFINQEINSILERVSGERSNEDNFSNEEITRLNSILDAILKKLGLPLIA